MHVHEFQAKKILERYGIPITPYRVVSTLTELDDAVRTMNLDHAVLKVQVHAGGRGKAGGVKLAKNRQEISSFGKQLLGMKIINQQTGPEGMVAHQLLITETADVAQEYYLGVVIDRKNARAVLIASPDGGMDIETIAHDNPERILTIPIQNDGSLRSFHLIKLAKFMGWKWDKESQPLKIVKGLAKAFLETDASLLEINPLIQTKSGAFICLDAKLTVDDNALFRQELIASWFDPTQLPEQEARARENDLAYVSLEGNIGCMVNGAGLAMATMDIIHHFGGTPANFLDVGGGATKEKVAEGFKLILIDPQVKAIFVNIFGGIMNCATIASGIIAAAGELAIEVPLIVRLEGNNVEQGKQMLKDSGLNIKIANSMSEGALLAVHAVKNPTGSYGHLRQ
jgi:succinyl-CoA synthetase beta subunit